MTAACARRLWHRAWLVLASDLSRKSAAVTILFKKETTIQVVRVVQTQPAALVFELVWRKTLQ
jgi:hypothetical protein